MRGLFYEIAAQNSYVFLDCIRLPTVVKWFNSEGVIGSRMLK